MKRSTALGLGVGVVFTAIGVALAAGGGDDAPQDKKPEPDPSEPPPGPSPPAEQPAETPAEQPAEQPPAAPDDAPPPDNAPPPADAPAPADQPDQPPAEPPKPKFEGPKQVFVPDKAELVAAFSTADVSTFWCGVPVYAQATEGYDGVTRTVKNFGPGSIVWGFQRPFAGIPLTRPADRYGRQFILQLATLADSDTYGWRGDEKAAAQSLAAKVGGVMARGNPGPLADLLREFAKAKVPGYARVTVITGSQEQGTPAEDPRVTIQNAIKAWRALGFQRLTIVIVISTQDNARKMIDECRRQSVPYAVYSIQAIQQLNISCSLDKF